MVKKVSFTNKNLLSVPTNSENNDFEKQVKEVLFKISDFLFENKISFVELLNKTPKIIDKVIDGKEYQLIKRQDMFDWIVNAGIKLSLLEQEKLKTIAKHLYLDFVDVGKYLI